MIEQTTFSNMEIQNELYKRYKLKVNNIEIVNEGTANIYKIMSDNGKFILKEFQSKYLQEDVLKEINAIEYLKSYSFKFVNFDTSFVYSTIFLIFIFPSLASLSI